MRSALLLSILVCSVTYGDSFLPALPMPSKKLNEEIAIKRIAVGSCYDQTKSEEIFFKIKETKPDLFLFVGDNVYASDESDDPSLRSLREAYRQLAQTNSFSSLRREVPVLTIWDDHDYGLNDAGGDWTRKKAAESLYEYVWDIEADDPRAKHDGVYFTRSIGPEGRRVQMIFLDTRYFRTPLTKNNTDNFGIYLPSTDPDQNMLGEEQWHWLEQQLQKSADLRIIVSSIMVLSESHGWESWRMMPKERQRFYDLIKNTEAKNIILVTGDTHAAAIYQTRKSLDYSLTELNSSSMNVPLTSFVKNPQRMPDGHLLGDIYFGANFGLIDIDWEASSVKLQIRDTHGATVNKITVKIENFN